MDKNLSEFLEKLSVKLGTTAEQLWRILIAQANVSAIQSLLYILFTIGVAFVLYKLHKKFDAPYPKEHRNDNMYDEHEAIPVIMAVSLIMWVVLFFVCLFGSIPNMINGFLNPQYWALKQILDSI